MANIPSRKPTRHSEFWFSDGSVVLLAQDILFRVHKSFLARHSLVFRDMFSLPQPTCSSSPIPKPSSEVTGNAGGDAHSDSPEDLPDLDVLENGEAILEGCPVIPLHDSPDDVESLLYALYDGPKFGDNSAADFRVVSGILRLASKYEIDRLRTRALEHLSVAWPSTLKGWDAREETASIASGGWDDERFYPSPVEVINLAREVNAPSLLPSAFYDLSRYPLSETFQACQRSSSLAPSPSSSRFTESSDSSDSDSPSSQSQPPPPPELSLADTQRLALGKESSHHAVTTLIRSLATEARSNPSHVHPHTSSHHTPARRFAARHQHRRSDSLGGGAGGGRCTSPASCWRDVCELVDLATQHYLFDRERGAADPLYVAEELALLKGSSLPSEGGSGHGAGGVNNGRSDLAGPSGAGGYGYGGLYGSGAGGLEEDLAEAGTCRACARAFEVWSTKERERLWRAIPGWFKLDQF